MSKPVFEDLFKFSGRRNRESFIKVQGLLLFTYYVFFLLIIPFYSVLLLAAALTPGLQFISFVLVFIIPFVFLLLIFLQLVVIAQRLRDIGVPGFLGVGFVLILYALAVLVSTLNDIYHIILFITIIVLACVPGNRGENKYGPDPL